VLSHTRFNNSIAREFAEALNIIYSIDVKILAAETTANNFSIIIKKEKFSGDKPLTETARALGIDSADCSMLAVVGSKFNYDKNVENSLLERISRVAARYSPISFIKGSSDNTILIILRDEQAGPAMKALHRELFE
jgi:aspartokinase